jgi:hypothetical protein
MLRVDKFLMIFIIDTEYSLNLERKITYFLKRKPTYFAILILPLFLLSLGLTIHKSNLVAVSSKKVPSGDLNIQYSADLDNADYSLVYEENESEDGVEIQDFVLPFLLGFHPLIFDNTSVTCFSELPIRELDAIYIAFHNFRI